MKEFIDYSKLQKNNDSNPSDHIPLMILIITSIFAIFVCGKSCTPDDRAGTNIDGHKTRMHVFDRYH